MATVTYFTAIPPAGFTEQVTMLATGDDDADLADMEKRTAFLGWEGAYIGKWQSWSLGCERMEDGSDRHRHHRRLWVVSVGMTQAQEVAP